ncbi:hypothetical protein EB796_009535 [Bugula neritina]|uniref:Uncharacterized protein n=1 Tax=Bugula neritina TaxID=10212 RepID=A0A7J7K0H7_BUGNE|nr:hypothetical protein EB796_009535 [Bugula neritina]
MEVEAFCSSDESLVKVQAEHEAAKSTFLEVSSHWNSISKDMNDSWTAQKSTSSNLVELCEDLLNVLPTSVKHNKVSTGSKKAKECK